MKSESGDQLDKLRKETARTLDKMSDALKTKKMNEVGEEAATGK